MSSDEAVAEVGGGSEEQSQYVLPAGHVALGDKVEEKGNKQDPQTAEKIGQHRAVLSQHFLRVLARRVRNDFTGQQIGNLLGAGFFIECDDFGNGPLFYLPFAHGEVLVGQAGDLRQVGDGDGLV